MSTGSISGTVSSPLSIDPDLDLVEERILQGMDHETMMNWDYGTYGCGLNLLPLVWSRHRIRFEIDPEFWDTLSVSSPPPRPEVYRSHPSRTAKSLLSQHPVDIFVADHSTVTDLGMAFGKNLDQPLPWLSWVESCPLDKRPKVILQLWQPWTLWKDPGPTSKHARKPLERLGYDVRFRVMDGSQFGGSVKQPRLVIVCFLRIGSTMVLGSAPETSVHLENWELCPPTSGHRPMSNCLRPTGAGPCRDKLPPHISDRGLPTPFWNRDPMPEVTREWIETSSGFRQIHRDEIGKGLGIPSQWITDHPRRPFESLVGIHLWNGISEGIAPLLTAMGMGERGTSSPVPEPVPAQTPNPPDLISIGFESETEPWRWDPPDLRPGRAWYRSRVRSLKRAARHYPESQQPQIISDGKGDLARHRNNYGPEGPKHLQLLWWEFPKEHWEDIRVGASMNFLKEPPIGLTKNANMDPEQLVIAAEFADELLALGIIERAPLDDPILANCPLFIVIKPFQPGQWRSIADCKKGGQNTTMGPGPVYLPQAHIILQQLYSGGWSAVIDASKYFYNFPTVVSERKYLGLIHPLTGEHYRYAGLPMGASSSPSIAGRCGAGFLRRLRERHPDVFQGITIENTWRRQVEEQEYNPTWGHGKVTISPDGQPASLVFGFVDDFFLHGASRTRVTRALNCFMDYALEVGLLCNPLKVTPPSQVVKYCGFLFDTKGTPTLRVPPNKRSRARAMVEYILLSQGLPVPRLSLSVVSGVLESQVPATPAQIGHTYLRRLYDSLWESDSLDAHVLSPKDRYYQMVNLSKGAWEDFHWWLQYLRLDFGRAARPSQVGSLVAHFGDGSGTGTGGTSELVGVLGDDGIPPPLEMWMGRWAEHVHSHSSNWKELKTLSLTLHRELARKDTRSRHTTLFYFTDNLVTYYVVNGGSARSPTLQAQIYDIKSSELSLQCVLEVVHIPGTSIIAQGSDDLSRGMWISANRVYTSANVLIPEVFAGVKLQDDWLNFLRDQVPNFPTGPCRLGRWDQSLDDVTLLDTLSLWAPPVEMAATLLSEYMTLWTERPETTSAVFLLPRVLQRRWQRISRFLQPLRPAPGSPHKQDGFRFHDLSAPISHRLPIIVLYLPSHVPSLPIDRLEPAPSSISWRKRLWYEQQKEHLYGVSETAQEE